MNALNIRARIASQTITHHRLYDIIARYGKEEFLACQYQIIDYVANILQKRLLEIPNGIWYEHSYIEHDGNENKLYEFKLKMTKRDDRLIFDFTGTSKQAGGFINCTRSGLEGAILAPIFAMLCYDLPWSSGAVKQLIEIISEEGTINNATFPAAVSMASIAATWATQNMVNNTIGKMLACSEKYRSEAQACWMPQHNGENITGLNREGKQFVDGNFDAVAGGAGARTFADGIDTGSCLHSLSMAAGNVEVTERLYPVLKVFRCQQEDSSGAGQFRGGVGVRYAAIPYKNPQPLTDIVFTHGANQPEAHGIFGGFPGSICANVVLRNTNVHELFAQQRIPTRIEEIGSNKIDILQAKDVTTIQNNDVRVGFTSGGGGYGDPLLREPKRVLKDIRWGLCSLQMAKDIYGVVVTPQSLELEIDEQGTTEQRQRIRERRQAEGKPTIERWPAKINLQKSQGKLEEGEFLFSMGIPLQVIKVAGHHFIRCAICHYGYGPAGQDPKWNALVREEPIAKINNINRFSLDEKMVVREYLCPDCGTLIAVDVQRQADGLLPEVVLVLD